MTRSDKVALALIGLIVAGGIHAVLTQDIRPPAPAPAPVATTPPVRSVPAPARKTVEPVVSPIVLEMIVKQNLHDPDSYQHDRMFVGRDGAACLQFRARNQFGGMRRSVAVIAPNGKGYFDEAAVPVWNKYCRDKQTETP